MTTISKPARAPFVRTSDLEALARSMFNGALPKLPADPLKRRAVLAKEFADAHLSIPGFCKPVAAKLAGLAPAFRAIASSRQVRVDEWLSALPQPLTHAAIREKLVRVMGERALGVRLLNARHAVAACLVLLDALEGRNTPLDLNASDANKLVARLDTTLGKEARQHFLPRGPHYIGDAAKLCAELADALLALEAPSAPPTRASNSPAPVPAKAASKGTLTRAEFDTLSPSERMAAIKRGVKLTD